MKTCHKILLPLLLLFSSISSFSQTNNETKTLVDSGVMLFDKGDYPGAMEKYKSALAENPNDLRADFELAYTLYTTGKGAEAIPYIEIILKSNDSKYESYELLGSIYDDSDQPDKAIEAYKAGIKEKPDYERLHFNLGITYLRLRKYADAETEAIEALKLDPTHASAQRLYGLATLHQNKKLPAIMAFCNFLLLEPQTKRSEEIYQDLDKVFKDGAEQKNITLTIDSDSKDINPMSFAESSISMAAAVNSQLEKLNMGSPVERLANELKSIFAITLDQSKKEKNKDFFWSFYADYFGEMAKTDNMPAFAHYISLSAYKDENLAWFKDHDKELKDLQQWVTAHTKRDF